ncbi:glutaredoxin 3 [Psychrobacter sp. HD31]|uniref:glutaredoxin 3 n=1 Tax=Psychrobacter sp. HD31 TaxID=3112003 RepID=UPI003DA5B49B
MTVEVTLYSTPVCPYCNNAKQLLTSKGVEYTEIGMMSLSGEERAELMKKTNNYRTVPQIFIGDTFIGGFDDLNKLNQEGKLDDMLAN